MESIELDAIDLLLLDSLQRDASLSNVALADKVNVSPPPACGASSAWSRAAGSNGK